MIATLLRKMGLAPPAPPGMDDQTYLEAVMDNALIDSSRSVREIGDVARASGTANAKLQAGIDRLRLSSFSADEIMACASRRRIHN